jgi:hypothetical protein
LGGSAVADGSIASADRFVPARSLPQSFANCFLGGPDGGGVGPDGAF